MKYLDVDGYFLGVIRSHGGLSHSCRIGRTRVAKRTYWWQGRTGPFAQAGVSICDIFRVAARQEQGIRIAVMSAEPDLLPFMVTVMGLVEPAAVVDAVRVTITGDRDGTNPNTKHCFVFGGRLFLCEQYSEKELIWGKLKNIMAPLKTIIINIDIIRDELIRTT